MKEIWKTVEEFPIYEVSNCGNIRSNKFGKSKILKLGNDRDGYKLVVFSDKGKLYTRKVHRVVAAAFIPNPNGLPEIDHKDRVKYNNNVDNLHWVTKQYNRQHKGFNNNQDKCKKVIQLTLDGKFIKEWDSMAHAAKELNVWPSSISMVCRDKLSKVGGFKWKYKDENK